MPSALVTGRSSGIGLAIGRMLKEEGFEVTLASRTAEKVEAAAAEIGAEALAADVSKPEDCARIVEEHVPRRGGLDVLVNSAGIGIAARLEDVQLKHLDRQLAIDTPMAEFSGLPGESMIQPEDWAEVVRMCLRLSPNARIPQVVIERVGGRGLAG